MRRRLRWAMAAAGPVLASLVAAVALATRPVPTRFTAKLFYDTEHPFGTTRQEVEELFGPPGDYRTGPTQFVPTLVMSPGYREEDPAYTLTWQIDDFFAEFGFNSSEEVVSVVCESTKRIPQSNLDNLLWRLKRQWHRWFP